jgi:hypothetical protein
LKTFTCQVVKPKKSIVYKVDADSIADAANETHMKARIQLKSGLAGNPCFAVVEVDGVEYLSRVFYEGIGRNGGIKPTYPSIASIAGALGFPAEDFVGDFEGEEVEGTPIDVCGSRAVAV